MNINTMIAGAAAVAASFAFAATPEVTAVSMSQASGSRLVTITYSLANAPAVVTLDVQTNRTGAATDVADDWVSIGGEAVCNAQGDVWKKVGMSGTFNGTITWRPDLSWPDHVIDNNAARAVVTSWALDNTPDYMVVDITAGAQPNTQQYYPAVDFLPGSLAGQKGAVTNNTDYRTTRLLMRKIMAKDVVWTMGSLLTEDIDSTNTNSPTHVVSLTNNFYIGVFELTQAQWVQVWGSLVAQTFTTDATMRPMGGIPYNRLRHSSGSANPSTTSSYWPNPPSGDSFLGLLRSRTGLDFDLPGEAEWEFACRAGKGVGYWNNGMPMTDGNAVSVGRMNGTQPGAYVDNSDADPRVAGTAICGSYQPNGWGLYDMHGNINEWCLDFYEAGAAYIACGGKVNVSFSNPAKTLSENNGGNRCIRGGAYNLGKAYCRPGVRISYAANSTTRGNGCRVVCRAGLD